MGAPEGPIWGITPTGLSFGEAGFFRYQILFLCTVVLVFLLLVLLFVADISIIITIITTTISTIITFCFFVAPYGRFRLVKLTDVT